MIKKIKFNDHAEMAHFMSPFIFTMPHGISRAQ